MANVSNLKKIKKGEVRNPNGINQYSAMNELREMLDASNFAIEINGKRIEVDTKGGNVRKAMFAKLIQMATDGDMRAIQEIMNRTEGKPIETVRTQEIQEIELIEI